MNYDLKITRSGEELNTTYAVVPAPHSPIPKEAKQAFDSTPINLEALFEGKDPFENAAAFDEFTPNTKKKAV